MRCDFMEDSTIENIESGNIEIDNGFKIIVGSKDILPISSRKFIDDVSKLLDRYDDKTVITNNEEFAEIQNDRVDIRKIGERIKDHKKILTAPLHGLIHGVDDQFRPAEQKYNVKKTNTDVLITSWASEYRKKIEEDKAEKLKKAEEMKIAIKQQNDVDIADAKIKTDVFLYKRKDEMEEKRKLETKKIEKEIEIRQISRQLEEKKEEISHIESSKTEEYESVIRALEVQKNVVGDELQDINIKIEHKITELRDIRDNEICEITKLKDLEINNQSIVVIPEPSIEEPPKISGLTIAKYLDFELVDLSTVPKEWTETVITLNEGKVRKALKLYGLGLSIPGIRFFEKDVVRSPIRDGHRSIFRKSKKNNGGSGSGYSGSSGSGYEEEYNSDDIYKEKTEENN